jgi:hypothetical protein
MATYTVTNKYLVDNYAVLQLLTPNEIAVGQSITVAGVDATFNGTAIPFMRYPNICSSVWIRKAICCLITRYQLKIRCCLRKRQPMLNALQRQEPLHTTLYAHGSPQETLRIG